MKTMQFSLIWYNKPGGPGPVNVHLDEKDLNSWFADRVCNCSQKLIEDSGGSRNFIDKFIDSKD